MLNWRLLLFTQLNISLKLLQFSVTAILMKSEDEIKNASTKTKVISCLQQLEGGEGGWELLTAPQTTTLCYSEDLNISRPIVSRINSATCNISKHITNILNPLMESTPHHIKHSTDALQTWAESRWCPSIVIWSHHLYTWSSGDHQITDSSLENRSSCTPSQICYSTASPPHFCNPL